MQETTAENLDAQTTALLCVDLQKCYYQPPVTHLFPDLESMFGKVLGFCRTNKVQVVHVRQEDVPGVSQVRKKDNILFSPRLIMSVLFSEFLRGSNLQLPG